MAEMTWEKSPDHRINNRKSQTLASGRWKFMLGGVLILVAIALLIYQGTVTGARFFIMVDEVVNDPQYIGQTVRLTGAVLGDSIDYEAETGTLRFTIANMPEEYEDLAETLHLAANDPNATRLPIFMTEETMPDLLQHEAQAILTGSLGDDGVFYATELNLKCPTRFEEHSPELLASARGTVGE